MEMKDIEAMQLKQVIWDDKVKGLHIKAGLNTKTFWVYYRLKGKQRYLKLGRYGDITLHKARESAKRVLALAVTGNDVVGKMLEVKTESMTVQQLFDLTYDEHWSSEKKASATWANNCKCYYNKHIKPVFGYKLIEDLTAQEIDKWHDKYAGFKDKPVLANKCLRTLAKMYAFAEERQLRKQGAINPCRYIKRKAEKVRSRYASEEERKKISAYLDTKENEFPRAVAFVRLLLLTGARPSTFERAVWDDFKTFSHGGEIYGWLTVDGKQTRESGDVDKIALSPEAVRIIQSLASLPPTRSETILGVKLPVRFWRTLQVDLGLHDLWLRDSRRTFASIGFSGGVSMDKVSELLNHKSTQTTRIYAKLFDVSKMKAVSEIASKIKSS